MEVRGSICRSWWGLAGVALLGLSGCLPASRGWVREQLAPVQGQVAEVRERVAVVEQQVGGLDPKVDRLLAQMEPRGPHRLGSSQPVAGTHGTVPHPSPSHRPGTRSGEVSLEFTITAGATPLAGGTTPPRPARGTTPPRPTSGKARKPPIPGRAAPPECLLLILKGEPCARAAPGAARSHAHTP
jgi:hypothetical protein